MQVHLKIKEKSKSLVICYFIIETKLKQNRTVNVALGVFQTIQRESHTCFSFYNYLSKQRIQVLMKLESCIILKVFLNFRDFESYYSCILYSYKKVCKPVAQKLKN